MLLEVTDEMLKLFGKPDPGTRVYRTEGTAEECAVWFENLCEHIGPCVSPGGVSMFANVSRAGVYARIKRGKMSAFLFHITKHKKALFSKKPRKLRESPYMYVPVSECKAWAADLEERVAKIKERVEQERAAGEVR